MGYDEVIERAAKAMARRQYPSFTPADIDEMWEGFTDDARAAAPILMEYGARLMREAGMLKANELFKSTEVFAMLYNIDPATIVREAVK